MSIFGTLFGHRTTEAPSGSLPLASVLRAATAFTSTLQYAYSADVITYTVANTNSMLPTFDANAVLLAEKVPFDALQEGDIVTYRNAGKLIVHRLNERSGSGWWPLGDGNGSMDYALVTADNFDRRICGILYGAKDATTNN